MANAYDYAFDCAALTSLLHSQAVFADSVIVTHWQGTEAVSQPYRFVITVAIAQADLALEKLLNQPATLKSRAPDGTQRLWHGIVTQGAEQGRDETHHYYQFVLEPRLVRLRAMRWSDIYLKRDLADLIKQVLGYADLTEPYSSDKAPYDYRIAATQLTQTQTDFTCQFEETCLDFLTRKLEYYGLYFWFEQGSDQESVVFANSVEQQPQDLDTAVYYPRGTIDPDMHETAIMQLNKRVGMPASMVVLHDSHEQGNTTLTLTSQANLPRPPSAQALGEFHSSEDHFEQLESTSTVSGATLATWRAQEMAWQRLRVEGMAQTPGIRAARFLSVSEYMRGVDPRQFYVIEVTHEGSQTVETSPQTDLPAYRATFVALPRYLNGDDPTSAPVQYRAPRITPVPQVSRLINGFVDVATPGQPKRFAQPDSEGRYKVRFLFARERYDGEQNSAFVRMATPYAGGASSQGLSDAGMHFPLREGTEVLLAFLNGNPDRPVIVSSLPNTEAPSLVTAQNSAHHRIGTPGGNTLVLADADAGGDGKPAINFFSPTENSSLNLGESDEEGVDNGFLLKTDLHGEIYSGSSMLIEVPGHYRVSAGTDSSNESQANFIGSEVEGTPTGITIGQSGGIVIENFLGMKIESVEALTMGHFLGAKVEFNEALTFESTLGAKLAIECVAAKELNLVEKNIVRDNANYANAFTRWVAGKWNGILAEKEEEVGAMKITALETYRLYTPDAWMGALGASVSLEPGVATLSGTAATLDGWSECTVTSLTETTIEGGISNISLTSASLALSSPTVEIDGSGSVAVTTLGDLTVNGTIVMIG
jgi:Rhs element Vgr protein